MAASTAVVLTALVSGVAWVSGAAETAFTRAVHEAVGVFPGEDGNWYLGGEANFDPLIPRIPHEDRGVEVGAMCWRFPAQENPS